MFWLQLQLQLQKFQAQLVQMLQEQSYEILPVLPIIQANQDARCVKNFFFGFCITTTTTIRILTKQPTAKNRGLCNRKHVPVATSTSPCSNQEKRATVATPRLTAKKSCFVLSAFERAGVAIKPWRLYHRRLYLRALLLTYYYRAGTTQNNRDWRQKIHKL